VRFRAAGFRFRAIFSEVMQSERPMTGMCEADGGSSSGSVAVPYRFLSSATMREGAGGTRGPTTSPGRRAVLIAGARRRGEGSAWCLGERQVFSSAESGFAIDPPIRSARGSGRAQA